MTPQNRYLVIVPGYPSDKHRYNNAFVHSRVKAYKQEGILVDVFSVDQLGSSYEFDGVNVTVGSLKQLKEQLMSQQYTKLLVHFALSKIMKIILETNPNAQMIIWVHGYEALHWKRRIGFFELKTWHRMIGYVLINHRQLSYLNKLIKSSPQNITLVFVSKWMRDVFISDTRSTGRLIKGVIIPNSIDTENFVYIPKSADQRLQVLSIRPYSSKKYANDLSIDTVLELSKRPHFNQYHFTFYGDGRLFKSLTDKIKHFDNVEIHRQFLSHPQIIQLHQKNGIMLIPTRQDSQGVSMGEAMSSGLVPIASNNTAIPEFLDSSSGFLTNNSKEMADAIESLAQDPELFLRMSQAAAQRVRVQCAQDVVIQQEIDLIRDRFVIESRTL